MRMLTTHFSFSRDAQEREAYVPLRIAAKRALCANRNRTEALPSFSSFRHAKFLSRREVKTRNHAFRRGDFAGELLVQDRTDEKWFRRTRRSPEVLRLDNLRGD